LTSGLYNGKQRLRKINTLIAGLPGERAKFEDDGV
jgi:hypothetical protein